MPDQPAGFFGGMKRFAPAVEAPYGMPLKTLTSRVTMPRTLPDVDSATTMSPSAAPTSADHGPNVAAAIIPEARVTNVRRVVVCGITAPVLFYLRPDVHSR